MNQENRDKVINYLNSDNVDSNSSLYFSGYESPVEEFDPTKFTVEDMCKRVLQLTKIYPSYDADTREKQCSSGCNRSSLDIWRHITYYYSDVSIFDVMHALFSLDGNNDYYGFYCTTINRRIFKASKGGLSDDFQRNLLAYTNSNYDEYGLVWDDWKDI